MGRQIANAGIKPYEGPVWVANHYRAIADMAMDRLQNWSWSAETFPAHQINDWPWSEEDFDILVKLHLRYETGPEYPLEVQVPKGEKLGPEHCRIGVSKMRWLENKSVLKVNDRLRLAKIPSEAHEYVVNGRTPLEWFIDRYRVTKDSRSGIVNDPNGWFENPRDLIPAFKRIVHVSVETVRIVASLPPPFAEPSNEQA